MVMKNNLRKAILLTIIGVVFALGHVRAQHAELGIRFMPTFSSFDVVNSTGGIVKGTITIGYGAGLLAGAYFGEHFGIQGEVIYSAINQRYTENDVEQKVTLKYINIPVLASFNTGKSNPVNLSFVAGPQVGISVGGAFDGEVEGDSVVLNPQVNVKKGDLGVAYGAGIDFGLDQENMVRLGLGFRGVYGLLDISDDSNTQTNDNYYVLDRTHIKTYAVYMGLSVLF